MKNLLTFLFLCLSVSSFSQENNGSSAVRSFLDTQDSLLQFLDKSRLATGVLYDRAFHWQDASSFKENDTLDFEKAMQLYHELYLSTYNRTTIASVDTIREKALFLELQNNVTPVGFINYAYEELDSNASADGRLAIRSTDSLLTDGTGATPYLANRLVAPVIFAEKLFDSVATFYFDPALSLVNEGGKTISAIKLENNMGEVLLLTPNSQGSLTVFSSSGADAIYLKSTILFLDGTTFGSWITLGQYAKTTAGEIDSKKDVCSYAPLPFSTGPYLKFQGYDESSATEGIGQKKVYYHLDKNNPNACDMNIRKPIIILDGYDAENETRPKPDDVYDLLAYEAKTKHLGLQLRELGYDVIVLNFPQYIIPGTTKTRDGGTDYMERNAMVLIKLIRDVNTELYSNSSKEQIVIMGPSMGGQISRYALKYLENNGQHHNCRMWIAFDSPNLGANIPLGIQTSIWYAGYMAGNKSAEHTYNYSIRSIATQQLLIYQSGFSLYPGVNSPAGSYIPVQANPLGFFENKRTTWQNMINNLGYPNNVRRIAIINGAANVSNGNSCSDILHYTLKKKGNPSKGKTLFELYPKTMTNSASSICRLFDGSINGSHFNVDLPYTNALGQTIPYYQGDLDDAPGGLYDAALQLKDKLEYGHVKIKNAVWGLFTVHTNGQLDIDGPSYHCFIPTVSSLGLYSNNFNWNTQINIPSVFCANGTPFHNIFVPPTNEAHVTINQNSVNFLLEELDPGSIVGPEYPIACKQNTYTLNVPIPSGATVTWTAIGGEIQFTQISSTSVLVRPYYSEALAILTAVITYPNCVKRTFTFSTKGTADLSYDIRFTGLPNCNWQASVYPALANEQYQWSTDGIYYYPLTTNSNFVPPGTSGYIPSTISNVWVKVNPAFCRNTGFQDITKTFNKTGSGCDIADNGGGIFYSRQISPGTVEKVEVLPNPTTADWSLVVGDPEARNIEATLKDAIGRNIWSKSTSNGAWEIPVIPGVGLSAGVYLLYVKVEGKQYQFKLLKQ